MAKPKEIYNDLNLVLRLNQHLEALTATEASAAALLTKESSFKVLTELASIETPDPREDAQFDHQRAAFRASSDASALPFHLQGDQAFNEASALARRRQLRHSDAIKAKIQFLWHVARGRDAVTETSTTISEREYSEMMLLIFKVLRDDFVLETAQLQIQCDWEVDSRHGLALAYDQFFPALFELVDVWTCDILEATYARFLELLTRRITVRVVVFLDDMKLKLALSDNFDEAVVVKAIPLSTIKQFASVAKVLQGTNVRTVGDLASADPRVVERQRVGYLESNAFSRDKIGGDLEHLLQMFRDVSEQFQHANYAFRDRVLQRVPNASSGTGDRIDSFDSSTNAELRSATSQASTWAAAATDRSEFFNGSGSSSGRNDSFPSSSTASGVGFASVPERQHEPVNSGRRVASDTWSESGVGRRGSGGTQGGGARVLKGTVSSGSGAEAEALLRRGGIKRINTFRDITVTETGVLDALKASFLIEKGISIQRKASIDAIRTELVKFGVDPTAMDDVAIREKYDRLYEMFVLRDGDNIKALAESIIARIKMELAAHGIEVNDDEMEAMYNGFYGSVVAGSGERIVADAKSWVDETVSAKSYGTYVKQEYHELKSIDEVTLLGTGTDDEEFVSLLSKEDLEEGPNGGASDVFGGKSESPTTKAVAPLSKRPSLYRGLSESPKKDKEQPGQVVSAHVSGARVMTEDNSSDDKPVSSTQAANQSALDQEPTTTPIHEPLTPVDSAEADRCDMTETDAEDTQASSARAATEEEETLDPPPEGQGVNTEQESASASAEPVAEPEKQSEIHDDALVAPVVDDALDPLLHSDMTATNDEVNKRSSVVTLKPSNSRSNLFAEDAESLDGNHGHLDEIDREPQGIGFEYEDKDDFPVVDVKPATPERPPTREPKVPDIVVGGIDTGRNIAVTARYIQLLGLANVVSITPENELLAQLQSPAKDAYDLVLYDIGDELDTAVTKAKELVSLVGRRVIFLGGDVRQPEKTEVVARLCVSEGGVLYFGRTPIDFPALRTEIQAFFEAFPHLFVLRQRRATGVFGAAAKLLTSSIRATNMIQVDEDHPRSVLTPPLSVDDTSAKRKASSMSPPQPTASLPPVAASRRETFSPFRSLRVSDEMPGADVATSKRFTPIVPSSHPFKAKGNSPRMSAALKKLMR